MSQWRERSVWMDPDLDLTGAFAPGGDPFHTTPAPSAADQDAEQDDEAEYDDEDDSVAAASSAGAATAKGRRGRKRIDDMLEAVLREISPPPEGKEVKYMSQKVRYVADKIVALEVRNEELEMQLALESKRYTVKWVDKVVGEAKCVERLLVPVMKLVCRMRGWMYGEGLVLREGGGIEAAFTAFGDDADQQFKNEMTSCRGTGKQRRQSRKGDDESLQSGVLRGCQETLMAGFSSEMPLVLEALQATAGDQAYRRDDEQKPPAVDDIVQRYGISVILAMPMMVRGVVAYVLVFYDVRKEQLTDEVVSLVQFVTRSMGNAVSAQTREFPLTIDDEDSSKDEPELQDPGSGQGATAQNPSAPRQRES